MSDLYRTYTALPLWDRDKKQALVDTSALRANYRRLRGLIPAEKRMMAVVKADAYGHGIPACVKALLEEDCDFFVVSCLSEGVAVRQTCTALGKAADILVLSPADLCDLPALMSYDLIGTLSDPERARALSSEAAIRGQGLRLHLAVDSGMHRVGFPLFSETDTNAMAEEIAAVCALPGLRIEGIFSHLSRADEENEAAEAYTALQSRRFFALCAHLKERRIHIPLRHLCNTAALRYPALHLNGVRVGIGLYGYGFSAKKLSLSPVMRLRAVVVHLHTAPANEGIGYGGRFVPDSPRLIATIPVGYADGFLRAYSGAEVTVHTQRGDFQAPVVGAVCMDLCMLDVTDLPVRVGDAVTLFGNGREPLEALAKRAETIPYESLCLISARIPRRYL